MQAQARERPNGVTALGILAILVGIGGILAGSALLVAAMNAATITSTLQSYLSGQMYSNLAPYVTTANVQMVLAILAAFSLIVGILWLAGGWGFLNGKKWAWTLGIVILALSIINSAVQTAFGNYSSIISIVIDLAIVYYLTRPQIKAWFGRGTAPATPAKM